MNILQTLLAATSGYEIGQTLLLALVIIAIVVTVVDVALALSFIKRKKKGQEETVEESTAETLKEETESEEDIADNVEEIAATEADEESIAETEEESDEPDVSDKFLYTYDRSFKARLIQAQPETQDFYGEIKNYLLSYEKMKARLSWVSESFRIGRKLYAKMRIMGKKVQLYLALNPDDYAETKYEGEHVGERSKYKDVPFKFVVTSNRKVRYAKYLISQMMQEIKQNDVPIMDYREEYQTTEALLEQRLIRLKK